MSERSKLKIAFNKLSIGYLEHKINDISAWRISVIKL